MRPGVHGDPDGRLTREPQACPGPVDKARSGLEAILVPGRDAYESPGASIEVIGNDLPRTRREPYFGSTGAARASFAGADQAAGLARIRTLILFPSNSDACSVTLIRFVITAGLMVVAASQTLRS